MKNSKLSSIKKVSIDASTPLQTEKQFVAVDSGSTGIRSVIMTSKPDSEMSMEQIKQNSLGLEMSSAYVEILDGEFNVPVGRHDTIADKLEMSISNQHPEAYIKKIHIIRESLIELSGQRSNKIVGSVDKKDQQQTFVNIISGIAMSLLNKSITSGVNFASSIDIDLVVTFPPEELKSAERVSIIEKRLTGKYVVEFTRLGISLSFEINPENLTVISEPEASLYYAEATLPVDTLSGNSVLVEVGGRSVGFLSAVKGRPNSNAIFPSSLGGQKLLDYISDILSSSERYDCHLCSINESILETGKLDTGAKLEVVDVIDKAKKKYIKLLYNEYLIFLDKIRKPANAIDSVILVGKVFNEIITEDGIVSTNMIYDFEKMLKEDSSHTVMATLDVQYPIPYGGLYFRFGEL